VSSSSSSIFTIVYCARVFFAQTKQLPKNKPKTRGRKKKKKVGSEVENVITY